MGRERKKKALYVCVWLCMCKCMKLEGVSFKFGAILLSACLKS